jgi:predicted Zn-dependent protease
VRAHPRTNLAVFALTIWCCGIGAFASPVPQVEKRSKSDADINAIGHRRIDHGTNFYSIEKEKELGKALSTKVEKSSKLFNDSSVTEYVERVAQNVAKNSDTQMAITVHVIDSDAVSAFTLPGGYQYVSRGLLFRLESESELASVLARGIAQTALRSATVEATRTNIMQLATIPAISSSVPGSSARGIPPPSSPPFSPTMLGPAMQEKSRADELDADYFGVQYVYKAGCDPQCFVDFVQRIWGAGATDATTIPDDFRALPPVGERITALQNEISKIFPSRDHAVVSTPEFDKFKQQLRGQKSGDPTLAP